MVSAQDNSNTLLYKGEQSFKSKNYDKASSYFSEAIKKKDSFDGHYNLGNAFHKRKMYTEAKAEYEKALALAKNKEDRMAAQYNLGNNEMQENNFDKAAEHYKKALKQDPYNEVIRKNYNIAKLKQKEQEQQQKAQQESKNEKQNQQNNNQSKDENSQNPSQDPQNQSQQNQGEQKEQNGKGNGNNPKPKEDGKGNGLSKEEEERIMRRLEGKERETARRILNRKAQLDPRSNDKDW